MTVDLEQIGLSGWEGASSETKRCAPINNERRRTVQFYDISSSLHINVHNY